MSYDFDEIIDRHNSNCVKYKKKLADVRPKDSIVMTLADMDLPVMKEVKEALISRCNHEIYGYGELYEELPALVTKWYTSKYNASFDENDCIITPSVNTAIAWCIQTFTDENDSILIQNPSYSPFRKNILLNNRKLLVNELFHNNNTYSINFADFEEKCKNAKMFILCNPHNPIGKVWDKKDLEKIIKICNKNNTMIISDEIHADWCFKKEFIPASSIDANIISIVSGSKSFNLQGLETSFIYIKDSSLNDAYKKTLAKISYMNNQCFSYTGFKAAYLSGEEWLKEAKKYIYDNYLYINNFFMQNIPVLKCIDLQATFLLWVDCSGCCDSAEQVSELFENKCHIYGNDNSHFDCTEPFIRLNIGVSRKVIVDMCNRLQYAIERNGKKNV